MTLPFLPWFTRPRLLGQVIRGPYQDGEACFVTHQEVLGAPHTPYHEIAGNRFEALFRLL